jgi:sulfate adenylyltransferase subunit 2
MPDDALTLHALEQEAITIIRETLAQCRAPALLFSGGKDSAVLLHLARKAAYPEPLPLPLLHVDTGHNFPEVIAYRDQVAERLGVRLIVASVEDSIARGSVRLPTPSASRNGAQAVTLKEAIAAHGFDALLGGARRDEDKARAKERVYSHRDSFGQWEPRHQRPELWRLANLSAAAGDHWRVFPLSHWTERDIWAYIVREDIALPDLYFAHERAVVAQGTLLQPVTHLTPAAEGSVVEQRIVRFRTVGDMTCTCPVDSQARNAADILAETLQARVSERGATRMDDKAQVAAMERRKREGYF